MGYNSKASGSLSFEEPLVGKQIEALDDLPWYLSYESDVEEKEVTTEDGFTGTLFIHRVHEIVAQANQGKLYEIRSELETLAKKFPTLTGIVYRSGEDQGDVERYIVSKGSVVVEKALLTWPDGEKVEAI